MTTEAHTSYLHNIVKRPPKVMPPGSGEFVSIKRHKGFGNYSVSDIQVVTSNQVVFEWVEITNGLPRTVKTRLLSEDEINENGGIVARRIFPMKKIIYLWQSDVNAAENFAGGVD